MKLAKVVFIALFVVAQLNCLSNGIIYSNTSKKETASPSRLKKKNEEKKKLFGYVRTGKY